VGDPADPPLATMFENRMVKLLAGDVGALVVEHADGYRRVLDPDESGYLRAVRASAIAHGVPDDAYGVAAGEYLFQVCLGARNTESEVWELVFRTVSADRMGEIIAEDYLQAKGVKP
jgi:hypothetical protein